jgi:hypothetical protein
MHRAGNAGDTELGEMVVQFWFQPGETTVTLGAGEEQEVERIPEQLNANYELTVGILHPSTVV